FNFDEKGIQEISYTIFDLTGKSIDSQKLNVSDYLILDLSAYKTGVYLIQIDTKTQSFTKKVQRK
ncbi:MAG: T9SS type A sorting domain-containing protein, partial [Bacteroidales bacterium]|nr:T9SS type A sorting domain-containing protein [Bacteroidales bacterium]